MKEARADLRRVQAMARQTQLDRAARYVASVYWLRNSECHAVLFEQEIFPAAPRVLENVRQSYTAGTGMYLDLIEAQRTLLDVRLTIAEARAAREKRLAELEALAGVDVEKLGRPTTRHRGGRDPGHHHRPGTDGLPHPRENPVGGPQPDQPLVDGPVRAVLPPRDAFATLTVVILLGLSTLHPMTRIGSEFMPQLEEGDLLYMPTTDPSISVTKSKELLQQTGKLIAMFPEVNSVHGQIGGADTATDPAPLSIIETVVQLHTNPEKWRTRNVE